MKVSICIPTYNGESHLQKALDSILEQSYRYFEVVISDDGSIDQTLQIAERFKDQADFLVRIYNHSPEGIGANWNNCLKYAKGEYIKFLFQDDIIYPDCIKKMVELLEHKKEVALVASKRDILLETGMTSALKKWLHTYENLQKEFDGNERELLILDKNLFLSENFMTTPLRNKIGEPSVVMFRRNVINTVGFFNEDLKQILDYEFYYRILKKHKVAILPEKLGAFRIHENQATNINRIVKIDDYEIYDQILYKDYFWLLNSKQQKKLFFKYHPIATVVKKAIRIKNKMLN